MRTNINIKMNKAFWLFILTFNIVFYQCKTKKSEVVIPKTDAEIISDSLAKIYKIDTKKVYAIDTLIQNNYAKGLFNGNVLIAENGVIIYQKALGSANLATKDSLKLQTRFQLASVSKQFTAVAILQLAEQKKLDLKTPVYKVIPEFPFDSTITIHSLLCHSSGIPNYIYALDLFMDKKKPVNNQQVSSLMAQYKPGINYIANTHFNYNNSNYMYLALIVEKISKIPFRKYIQTNIFDKANMKNTFYYDTTGFTQQKNLATGYDSHNQAIAPDYLDQVVGDKGIYSTIQDLYHWNMALFNAKLLNKRTLQNAFSPKMNYDHLKDNNYGYGWRLKLLPDSTWQVYHGGWWHGFRNYTTIWPQNNTMVIILGNFANKDLAFVKQLSAILKPEYADFYLEKEKETDKEPQ